MKEKEIKEIKLKLNYFNWKVESIALNIIDRMDIKEINEKGGTCRVYDAMIDALNDELVYDEDQWEILKYYCNPVDADWDYAIDNFIRDLYECLDIIYDEI